MLGAALLFMLSAVLLTGQSKTGEISGTVLGPKRTALAEVSVTVTDLATQGIKTVVSSAQGTYYLPKLHAGAYELTTKAPGFRSFKQNVYVSEGSKVQADIHLDEAEPAKR